MRKPPTFHSRVHFRGHLGLRRRDYSYCCVRHSSESQKELGVTGSSRLSPLSILWQWGAHFAFGPPKWTDSIENTRLSRKLMQLLVRPTNGDSYHAQSHAGCDTKLSRPSTMNKPWGDFHELMHSIRYIVRPDCLFSCSSWRSSLTLLSRGFAQTNLEWTD